ncbi:MAG TPA: hypothetical protein VLK33_19440, partial [Terriglobales bacterium]|nr:hypothetical protein [Terriglobales bacterium]
GSIKQNLIGSQKECMKTLWHVKKLKNGTFKLWRDGIEKLKLEANDYPQLERQLSANGSITDTAWRA